jgi:outer membrane immunogenic protein
MKKLALAVSILVVSAVSASAADLAPVYTKAPPIEVAPACVWCGFYVGGNVGYAGSESTSVNSSAVVTNPGIVGGLGAPALAAASLGTGIPVGSQRGIIGGGQFGFNFQSGRYVAGFEADIQGLSGRATGASMNSVPVPGSAANGALTATHSADWLSTVRARIGWAVVHDFLLYGTGGFAFGGVHSSTNINQTFSGELGDELGSGTASGNSSEVRFGWVVGAGGEWMFARDWSAKLEYLHYELGSTNNGTPVSNVTEDIGTPLFTLAQSSSTNFRGDIVRFGVNHTFDWDRPVVAKY